MSFPSNDKTDACRPVARCRTRWHNPDRHYGRPLRLSEKVLQSRFDRSEKTVRHRDVSSAQMLPGHGDEQRLKTVPRRRTAVAALRLLHSQHARTAQSINFILHPRRPLSSCVFTVECVRSFVVVRLTSFVVRLSSVVVRLSSFVCRRSFVVVRLSSFV